MYACPVVISLRRREISISRYDRKLFTWVDIFEILSSFELTGAALLVAVLVSAGGVAESVLVKIILLEKSLIFTVRR